MPHTSSRINKLIALKKTIISAYKPLFNAKTWLLFFMLQQVGAIVVPPDSARLLKMSELSCKTGS